MKVARVNGRTIAVMDSFGGLGGSTPVPGVGDLSDVDTGGLSDGDTLIWDDATDTWIVGPGGGGSSLPWYDVTTYGATGDGSTDDTTAVQDAIDACFAAGGGTVFFPPGIYQISGALQNTSTHNSQLVIPTASAHMSIRFLGFGPNKIYGGTPSVGNESVIRSDWNGSISGNPAIISAGTWHAIGESVLYATFQDLTIVAPDDPKLTALQMTACQSTRIQNVQIRTTSAAPSSAPTHANSVGLDGPWGLASIVPDYAIGLDVYGFFTGIVPQEQFHGIDIGVAFCNNVMKFIGGSGSPTYTHYPVVIEKLVYTWCQYGLVFETDTRWVQINSMSVEHDSGAFTPVADIYDPNNYAKGFIAYHALAFSGTMEDLIFDGGANLSLFWGEGQYWKLNSVVEIPTGTDPSTNPATGGKFYAASATGHPSWRDSAGTVTDLLSGGSPTGAAGGDLSGTYPNPSVVDDSHSHTAATAPGSGGSGHYEVIVSGTAPPVAVTNIAEDDWLYGWVPD